jgi:hypothetical protein
MRDWCETDFIRISKQSTIDILHSRASPIYTDNLPAEFHFVIGSILENLAEITRIPLCNYETNISKRVRTVSP